MKKKTFLRRVSILLVSCLLFATVFSNSAIAISQHAQHAQRVQHQEGNFQKSTIDTLNNYVFVNSSGKLYFKIPEGIKSQLGTSQIELAQQCINKTNNLISSGSLVASNNGTLYNPSDTREYIQGNKSGYQYFWWGIRTWWTQRQAVQLQGVIGHMSLGAAGGLVGFGVAGIFVPFLAGVAIGLGFGSAYYAVIANDISVANGRKGIIFDLNYWGTYSIYPQS